MSILNSSHYPFGYSLIINNTVSMVTHSMGLFYRPEAGRNSIRIAVTIANISGRLFDVMGFSSSFVINRFHKLTEKENICLGISIALLSAYLTPYVATYLLRTHPIFKDVVVNYSEALFYSFLPNLMYEGLEYCDSGKFPTLETFKKAETC
ncbi:hypothetical protein [Simkania sp.]|uniref:hypothetical protein n=1 Tax=Simkania sp. TaxID=34094 RepID=UPI003B524527